MLNNGTWGGRLTSDPQLSYTNNGKPILKFTLACQRPFKNKQTDDYDADFIPVEFWGGKAAESAANILQKGDSVGVPGRIQTNSVNGEDGKRKFFWNVVADRLQFIHIKKWNEGSQNNQNQQQGNNEGPTQIGDPIDISDDSLPF